MKLRKIYLIHKYTGLCAGIFIFILVVSGSILVFHDDLDQWQLKRYSQVQNTSPVSVDMGYRTVSAQYADWDVRLIRFSERRDHALVFQLRKPEERLLAVVHPSNGALIKVIPQSQTLVYWVLKLHYTLLAGLVGEMLVLLSGLLFIISLLTGLIVYRKVLLKTLLFRVRFSFKTSNAFYSSLHRYVGVWSLLLNLLMGLSGVVISYEIVSAGLKKQEIPQIALPEINISIDGVLKDIQLNVPDFKAEYIRFPLNSSQPMNIAGSYTRNSPFFSKYYNVIKVDINSGDYTDVSSTNNLSSLVRGIHFVEYGNGLIRVIFVLVGLSAGILTLSAYLIWVRRRK